MHFPYFLCPAAADPPPAQRADETDDDHEPDRPMDFDLTDQWMIFCMILYVISCREQDCVVVLAPYPNNPNPVESFNLKTDFNLTGDSDGLVWYARSKLFSNCTL